MNVRIYKNGFAWLCIAVLPLLLAGYKSTQQAVPENTAQWFNQVAEDTLEHNPVVSRQMALKALKIATVDALQEQQARAFKNIAETYYETEEFDTSTHYFKQANKLYTQLKDDEQTGYTYLSIGLNYYYQGDYTQAISAYKKAEMAYEKTEDTHHLALVYQNTGLVYNELGNTDKALEYLNKSQNIFLKIGATYNIANNYHNIGAVYSKRQDYKKASEYYQKSYPLFYEIDNLHGLGSTLNNIGMVLVAEGKYEEALNKYDESLDYFMQEKNRYGELSVYHNIGCALLKLQRYENARRYLEKSMELAKRHGYIQNLMEAHKELSLLFEMQGKTALALMHYKQYDALSDSINNMDTKTMIARIESEYKHEIQDHKLEKQQLKLQRSTIQKITLLVFMLLFLVFSIVLYKINLRRKKVQQQLKTHKRSLQRLVEEQTVQLKAEISERKMAEESDKLKSAFLANMSHELRTPMNAIIAFSTFLQNSELSEEKRKEYIQHINSSGKSLLQIIDDIVDSAKIEAKQLKIAPKKTDITRLLKEVYELYIHSLKMDDKEEIDLVLDIPHQTPVIIETDPVRLKQIIANLVENAKKYTQNGYIRFGYELKHEETAFFVEDTGIGIPDDKQNYIFERFSRIDYKDDKRLKGTGLGLAICKDLVELMNGSINVRSEFGVGSVFTFTLPCRHIEILKEDMTEYNEHLPLDPTDFNWADKVVLIAEDEDLNFKVLQAALSRTNANILRAMNGEEAIEICRQQNIDLILMDIQMPKMDGLEATRTIKKNHPSIPIIAQTSFALNGERERCLQAGCDDYLSKPIDLQRLLQITKNFLN